MLSLLGAPPLNARYVKRIAAVAEYRNAYVHYKWQPVPEGQETQAEKTRVASLLRDAESTARYLMRVEFQAIFGGKKWRLLLSVPAFAKVVLGELNRRYPVPPQKQ